MHAASLPVAPHTAADLIVWLDAGALAERDVAAEAVGTKARSLMRSAAAGLRVPPGFVVHPDAFAPDPGGAPARHDGGGGAAAVATSTAMSPAASAAIRAAYAGLGERLGEPEPLVAVRSSGAAEDLVEASFAGVYETTLGVRGATRVLEAADRCWRSLWSERAVAYRAEVERRVGHPLPKPRMAVLVQSLVPAEAAGVAFTADPSGAGQQVTISAAWGLGTAVVDGLVEPDTWRIERQTMEVVELTAGHKPVRRGAAAGAPVEPVPPALQDQPCLAADEAVAVARLALAAEGVLGAAADVEWALARGTVWLLQARPITSGPAAPAGGGASAPASAPNAPRDAAQDPSPAAAGPTPAFPFQWPDPADARLHWTQRPVDGRVPEAMPPLELDVRVRFARTLRHSADITGRPGGPRIMELNGWQYWCYQDCSVETPSHVQRRDTFKRIGDLLHERGENYLQAVTFPEMRDGNQRLAAVNPDSLSDEALAAHFQEAAAWYERGWTLHWTRPGNDPGFRFGALLKELTGEQRFEASRALLAHEPSKMTEAVEGLVALARTVQGRTALRDLFAARDAGDVLVALDAAEGGHAFRRELDAFLDPERQGLRSGASWGVEQNQVLPGWREQPELVIRLVQKYALLDLDALAAPRAEAIARRDRRAAEVRAGIADEAQRERFDFWLAAGRRAVQAQEDHNYHIDSATNALLHRAISACGRRLAAAAALDDPADVWWLREHQVTEALQGLQLPPDERPDHWRRLVTAQKALHEWQRSLRPPPTLGAPPPERPPAQAPPASEPAVPAEPEPSTLLVKGQPGAAGMRAGRVRLVDHRQIVPDVRPGDVLVAHSAGALWGPVAPAVAGVVLEIGGPFQHIMIVCREYGIPGIVNAKGAMERLRDGQQVVVDAGRGWVLAADVPE